MFQKVLVANRSEIAVRILRSLNELGVRSVAVASEADRDAPHALLADELRIIGPPPAAESYLNIQAILNAALETKSDAIHPGYGFLSENADFARACETAGLVFIGPSSKTIRLMGSKTESRITMEKAGIPVVPGFHEPGAGDTTLRKAARKIGWPVLIKASAGGGGKGMRVAYGDSEFADAAAISRSEAKAAFGSDDIYIEQYLDRPRHIEFQIFGDARGNIFHLGERECSIQRRHQKILEECPSVVLDPDLRRRMGDVAIAVARTVDYRNAGTVEFLLDKNGEFYFLEMNTRLQVEHPVTEMVYGVDLVAAQVKTAAGETLPVSLGDLQIRGHAIEARIYAEDPAQGFLPQAGPVLCLKHPERPGVRVDSGLAPGREVLTHYDPLLAKVIAWGEDRHTATRRLKAALTETTILGLTTNIDYLIDVLSLDAWNQGKLDTGFLEEHLPGWNSPDVPPGEVLAIATEAATAAGSSTPDSIDDFPSPWITLGGWTPLKDL